MQNMPNILPANPDRALHEMVKIIAALDDVYSRETGALEIADARTFMALQDEKLARANMYQRAMAEILRRKADMQSASPVLKQNLRDIQQKFSVMTQKNLKALKRMERLTDRLGNTIHKAARHAIEKEQTRRYGQSGHLHDNTGKTVSMGINETA